jgi:hypothetical protein
MRPDLAAREDSGADRRRDRPGRPGASGLDQPPRRRGRAGDLALRADQRAFVCGHSGSGKTFLALRWARRWRAGVAIDHKFSLTPAHLPGWEPVAGCQAAYRAWGPEHPRLIVRPVYGDLVPGGWYDRLAARVLQVGRVGWLNDEVQNVATDARMQPGFERVWGEGREKSVPAVAASQRPRRISLKLLSEADHLVIFRLRLAEDRQRMVEVTGHPELADERLLQGAHTFAHYRADTGELTVYGPLPPD